MIQFKRYPHRAGAPIEWSKRRASLAKSKPLRHAKKMSKKIPLFSEILEKEAQAVTVDPEQAKQDRQSNQDYFINKRRKFHAEMWQQGRKAFFECDAETQQRILEKWNRNKHMPKESHRFCGIVDQMNGNQAKRIAKGAEQTRLIKERVEREIWLKENAQPDFFS